MGLIINTNISSLNAQRSLLHSSNKLAKSFQRLSSGLRVNSAADDAAGLAISERFTSQIRGLNQSVRNANDAISLTQVAEGALQETTNILQRIRELAVQSGSDVNTDADREALNDEVAQLQGELQRIGETTTFNGQKLLDGSFTDKFFHVGMNFRETVRVRVRDARSETLGRWAVFTGTPTTTNALAAGDLALNGVSVRATRAQDDTLSTSFATGSAIAKAAAINDSTSFTGVSAYSNPAVRASQAAVAGGTLDQNNNVVINGRTITGLQVSADDANDALIRAINAEFDSTGVVARRDANGRIELEARDGRNIEVSFTGNGGVISGLDPTNAGGVTSGTVTLHSESQYELSGANETFIGFVDNQLIGVNAAQAMGTVDISNRDGANLALLIADRALMQVTQDRAQLGAIQNRLESTISNLTTVAENATSARSRILDADFAQESANLAKNQILQQAGTAILAQANSSSQNVLSLLQG
ncbi:MAG: flagellin [Myxococcales bacterium]|nr:flagellin [Myxococcales bacterium]